MRGLFFLGILGGLVILEALDILGLLELLVPLSFA